MIARFDPSVSFSQTYREARERFLHNSTYDFNDEVIPLGAGFLAAIAERAMPIAK